MVGSSGNRTCVVQSVYHAAPAPTRTGPGAPKKMRAFRLPGSMAVRVVAEGGEPRKRHDAACQRRNGRPNHALPGEEKLAPRKKPLRLSPLRTTQTPRTLKACRWVWPRCVTKATSCRLAQARLFLSRKWGSCRRLVQSPETSGTGIRLHHAPEEVLARPTSSHGKVQVSRSWLNVRLRSVRDIGIGPAILAGQLQPIRTAAHESANDKAH